MSEQRPTVEDMATAAVPISAGVLDWAIDEVGLTNKAVADKVGVEPELVGEWRAGQALPRVGQFHSLAKALRRPESFFFLAHPPADDNVPVAFRSPPEALGSHQLTADDAAHVRFARRAQRVSQWLVHRGRRRAPVLETVSPASPPDEAAVRLRAWLGWDGPSDNRGTDAQFARRVRADLEHSGVLVLHLAMGASGWRGFSLRSSDAPVVVANTHYNHRPRVFTYLHELAHLSADTESICTPRSHEQLERWCDRVASAVLMPAGEVRHAVATKVRAPRVTNLHGVRRVANIFTVSLRAATVRLDQLGLATPGLYDEVDGVARVGEVKKSRGAGGDPQTTPRIRLQTLGRGYVVPLLDAEMERLITRTDAMELLDVTASQLSELREFAAVSTVTEE